MKAGCTIPFLLLDGSCKVEFDGFETFGADLEILVLVNCMFAEELQVMDG
jgi:hypothetical protein